MNLAKRSHGFSHKILVTGSNGLLGQKIVKHCIEKGYTFLATSKGENRNPDCPESNYFAMDITNKLEINPVFEAFYPTHVIHTAAITNVDYCELNKEECDEVNVLATHYLFDATQRFEAYFTLLSTDFVFDGEKGDYVESDEVNPLSYYAESKVKAEKLLLDSPYKKWSIARTIIVFGQAHNMSRSNLVLWVYDSLKNNKEINVVTDQIRTPTWADDLALGCIALAENNAIGIYHLSGKDKVSMYDFAILVADYFKLDKSLIKATTSDTLNQPAKRPLHTGFDISKAIKDLNYSPISLKEALARFEF
ncbi:MAG: SDR family oxidoreductase [Flavobacteriia bacterium]|jgi:dTDP-4-dehydrorhamnose reductase